ncbi:MAG: RDD family protein [Myxococcota bacterium]
MSAAPQLSLATPERVELSLPVAGIGFRSIAYLIDMALVLSVCIVAVFVFSLFGDLLGVYESLSTWAKVAALLGAFATQWLYWTTAEVLWSGQTPGKRLMRIRVVRDDGSPVGFFESAVRNLCRVVDFLPVGYALGLLVMLVNPQHRRLGDVLAGTLLVHEERIDLDKYTAAPIAALPVAALGQPLAAVDVELLCAYLARAKTLDPQARTKLAQKLVEHYGASLGEEERRVLASSVESAEEYLRARATGP